MQDQAIPLCPFTFVVADLPHTFSSDTEFTKPNAASMSDISPWNGSIL